MRYINKSFCILIALIILVMASAAFAETASIDRSGYNSIKTDDSGAIDNFNQDPTSDALFIKLHKHLGAGITLTEATTLDATVLTVAEGHGAVAGNLICLKEGVEYYQGMVLSTTATTITLDMPLDFAFTAGAYCSPTTAQMGVDGSSVDQDFHIQPNVGVKWDITQMNCIINGTGVMDSAQFGDMEALTNGLVVRKQDGETSTKNLFNIKSNADWANRGIIVYDPKAPAGTSAIRASVIFSGQPNSGVVIRLDGALNQEYLVRVRDDISDVGMQCELKGHRVVD